MSINSHCNKVSNIGKYDRLNAAVGDNGMQDDQTYGEGFDLATKLLIEEAKKAPMKVDAIIYPLLFCARHRLELFIKRQIKMTSIIKKIEEMHIHDLNKLWTVLREKANKTDRR